MVLDEGREESFKCRKEEMIWQRRKRRKRG
jgi:hypothetical protein